MKKQTFIPVLMLFVCIGVFHSEDRSKDFPVLKGPYLGQKPPGENPEVFAPGIVSRREYFEHDSPFFSPDLKEVYWVADHINARNRNLFFMKIENGRWTQPQTATFCEHFAGANLCFSLDGKKLYFSSRRSLVKGEELKDSDIWYVERINNSWSEPIHLGPLINTAQTEALGTVLEDGTIYFSDFRNIYRSNMKDGEYQKAQKLSSRINIDETGVFTIAPFVAKDERYILFESNRSGGFGGADIYISFKTNNGEWSHPLNLGNKINTSAHERSPIISPDGKYLFFWRVTDGSDIYWVNAKIIEELKPAEFK